MGREAAKRWGGDGPPVEGGLQTFGVWVVQGWFAWNELCIGGGIGGGDAARRLPSFSAAPTLSSPRSVINLASEILNLAPLAYRFFLFQVTLSNLPLYGKSLYLQLCTRERPGYKHAAPVAPRRTKVKLY